MNDASETADLLRRLDSGDAAALDRLLETHRDYLRRLLEYRMEDDLRRRLDPSDVVQETQLLVSRRIDEFLERRPTSFKLWLRAEAIEKLVDLRRRHVLAAKRSVRREVPLTDASKLVMAQVLVDDSPSAEMRREELLQQAQQAVEKLSEPDQEIILLRHVEELDNAEIAEVLGINRDAASKRYGRAILRLRTALSESGS